MDDLPPWVCRDQRDRRKMIVWVNCELDKIFYDDFEKNQKQALRAVGSLSSAKKDHGPAIQQAEHGNIEPYAVGCLTSLGFFTFLSDRVRASVFQKSKIQTQLMRR